MKHLYRRGAQTHRHAVGGYQASGYSAGWRLCLTDWPSYINLTDAGSGSNKASWPHTGMHSHKEADAHTHTETGFTHTTHLRSTWMVESRQASKHTHALLQSQTLAIFIQALRHRNLFIIFFS